MDVMFMYMLEQRACLIVSFNAWPIISG